MHVGSVTSAEVRWATASWRVGSNGSPFSPKASSPNLPRAAIELLGHAAERPDQVAVVAGPVEVVEHRQQRASTAPVVCSAASAPVAVDPLAVVGVLRGDPLQVAGALVELGPQRLELRVGPAGSRPVSVFCIGPTVADLGRLISARRRHRRPSAVARPCRRPRRRRPPPGVTG